MLEKEQTIIISLGGSLIYTQDGINTDFLKKFEIFIRGRINKGKQFYIVCGGGFIARKYQQSAREIIGEIRHDDVDWLGIHATQINAHLLRTIFADIAHPRVIDQYAEKELVRERIVIAAGWKPGWSTDYCAVKVAENYNVKTLVNLSNIDVVYDKHPGQDKNASPIEKTSWAYFRKLVGERWDPGLNVPFDPIASKLAHELGLTVIIVKGDNFKNLENLFSGRKFKGTVIRPSGQNGVFYNRSHFENYKIGFVKKFGFVGKLLIFLRDLYRALKLKILLNPKSLLHVGSGMGEMVAILRFLGVEAYGLEISKYLYSKAPPGVKKFLKLGTILNIPYPDSSFDVVASGDVLEHVATEDLETAVKECNRVSKQYILHKIFTSENLWIKYLHSNDISHVSVFSKSWWLKFWQENGYSLASKFYPTLPTFMETIFLLKKKNAS